MCVPEGLFTDAMSMSAKVTNLELKPAGISVSGKVSGCKSILFKHSC